MTNKNQSGNASVLNRCLIAKGLFCFLIISSGGIICAEQNTGITINPVTDFKVGSTMTISGTYSNSTPDSVVVFISPKSYMDAQNAFWDETGSTYKFLLCPDGSDYCVISRTNLDGKILTIPYPNSPDCWSVKVPIIKGKNVVNTWECTFNGTIGDRIMQPDTYSIQVGGYEAGDLVEKTFKIMKGDN